VIFASIVDRRGRSILSIRDQNTAPSIRRRRLMTLVQLFLIHRYRAGALHYLTPTEDNRSQTQRMQELGIFSVVRTEIGQIIVADVNRETHCRTGSARSGLPRGVDPETDCTTRVASWRGLDGRRGYDRFEGWRSTN